MHLPEANIATAAPASASCRTRTCSRTATGLPRPDLIVVDESFWGDTVMHPELALDRLTEAGRWHVKPKGQRKKAGLTPEEQAAVDFEARKARRKADDDAIDAEDAAMRVRAALEDGRDPRTVVTAEECKLVASVEWGSRGGPGIDTRHGLRGAVEAWASWQNDECAKAGRFWDLLADEHEHPDRPMQRIVLERDAPTKDGDRRHLLHLHYRRELKLPGVPVILLDADLDPVIARKFWPQIAGHRHPGPAGRRTSSR